MNSITPKNNIYPENVFVEIPVLPGQLSFLPLKTCLNNPFLNISFEIYRFIPKTKLQFVGLVEYIPELILNKYQIKINNSLIEDYKILYRGIHAHLAYSHGYYSDYLPYFTDSYFKYVNEIYLELFELINLLILYSDRIPHYQNITPSPLIWFSCLFNELENVFLTNGILGKYDGKGKKDICTSVVQNYSGKINNVVEGQQPLFGIQSDLKNAVDNKRYLLGCLEYVAAQDDFLLKKLKNYYKLEKQFFRKFRDSPDHQVGFLNSEGEYCRGSKGKKKNVTKP